MLARAQILDRLGEVFAQTLHIRAPATDVDLLEEGVLDSFQFVELLLQVQKHFDLEVDFAEIDLEDLRTLGHIARLIERNTIASEAPGAARTE